MRGPSLRDQNTSLTVDERAKKVVDKLIAEQSRITAIKEGARSREKQEAQ